MLKLLSVRNFAVIDAIVVEFKNGLNLLTGETGSGKSILVDALGLLLGERGFLSQIRSGEKSAFVEGIFEFAGDGAEELNALLAEAGIEGHIGDEIVIRREVVASGKTRIFINDRTVGISMLRQLQPLLVETHGQGEQKLLRSTRAQLELLDAYAGLQALRLEVGAAYAGWRDSLTQLQKLRAESDERARTLELVQYQLSEIDAVSPHEQEDDELMRERTIMANSEKILEGSGHAYNELFESEGSVLERVGAMTRRIRDLSGLDHRLEGIVNVLDESAVLLSEAADSLRTYIESIDFSPDEFARVDNRLSEIERIKRKFGFDLKGLFTLRETLSQKLSALTDVREEERKLTGQFETAHKTYIEKATKLTSARKAAAHRMERDIIKELQHVALKNSRLTIAIDSAVAAKSFDATEMGTGKSDAIIDEGYFSPYGADKLSFLFSANPGEDLRPLSQVASGGELSRLMLTILTVSAKTVRQMPGGGTLIFDEIDSGIGGRVAEAVGRRLKTLAQTNQVLCVTHQPQIARFADAHFRVEKNIADGRAVTSVEFLDKEERVKEVARMIAGDQEAETTIETARWMLETAET